MREIGDDLDRAVKVSAQETEYTQDQVLYAQLDTTELDLNTVSIFKYAQNADSALYRVSFSQVGEGRGDYLLTNSTTNGRVYEWVSPVGGVPQGNYAPIVKIPAPNRKDMMTLGDFGEFEISKYERIFTEMAFSKNDVNRFSEFDSEDDNGFAIKGGIESSDRPISFLKDYRFSARGGL
jgi:hypothetical protein